MSQVKVNYWMNAALYLIGASVKLLRAQTRLIFDSVVTFGENYF